MAKTLKVGIVFAGQGAQYPGMGQDLYQHSEAARRVFDAAGEQVREWCFHGTKEQLQQTNVTQPSIYVVTMAAYRALEEALAARPEGNARLELSGFAGFSLGEYSAMTAAGVLDDIQTGQELVTRRGQWMNEAGMDAQGRQRGGMAAAFGKRQKILDAVNAARGNDILEAVNFNSPIQTVVAGTKDALQRFQAVAKEHRLKVKPLPVSTAFHSPLMRPAVAKLKEYLRTIEMKMPAVRIYSNVTGRDLMEEYRGGEIRDYIADRMAEQAMSPVYWQETVENMMADGIQAFIEVGPGKTLSGLIKKISRKVTSLHVEDMDSLADTTATLENRLQSMDQKEEQ